jgi:ComF family protein
MEKITAFFKIIQRGLVQLLFPNICVCCGQEVVQKKHHICPFCLEKRFVYAASENRESSSNVILPHGVILQQAMWTFDKGGLLQDLMHHLKYERLIGIGYQLGKALARRLKKHSAVKTQLAAKEALLIPVPLHYLKFRKRGFNQAFSISRGIQEELSIPICSINAVRRNKYTQSQTGFTLQKRINNMKDAFTVSQPDQVKGKMVIIVDDVFTTGSTSFELAKTLKEAGADSIMIWTVAQA